MFPLHISKGGPMKSTMILGVWLLMAGLLQLTVVGEDACPPEVTAWLVEHAIPFVTTDPEAPLDDLEPLREIIGDARIVALGEQTHGTSEFFQMKHRIFRFLVEEMGFRVFAFEADWLGLIELNACLQAGGPPIEAAFGNLGYWVWQTEEVMGLLRWMRAFNEAHPDGRPVQLVGVDTLREAEGVPASLVSYLNRVHPTAAEQFGRLLQSDFVSDWTYLHAVLISGTSARRSATRVEERVAVLDPVIAWMRANVDVCVAASTQWEFDLHLRTLELASRELARVALLAGGETSELDSRFSLERDRLMAENVAWWLEFLGETKTAIWAHNGHVARDLSSTDLFVPMGRHLAEAYGDDYLAIGFSFAEGTLTAYAGRPRTFAAEPLIPGCYEAALQTAGPPRFVADLRDLQAGSPVFDWMGRERDFRMIGAVYAPIDSGWDYPCVLPVSYDVIIHIQTSTAAVQWTSD